MYRLFCLCGRFVNSFLSLYSYFVINEVVNIISIDSCMQLRNSQQGLVGVGGGCKAISFHNYETNKRLIFCDKH